MPITSRSRFIVLVVVILTAVLYFWFYGVPFSPTRTITVAGVGSMRVKPAKATVSFSVTYDGASREEAINQGESVFNTLLNGLKEFGDLQVDRNAYQITENTKLGKNPFQYVNAAKITTSDPAKIAAITKYLYASGANTVTQVRYIPADEAKVEEQLRELAVKDARTKAQQMARGSGARLGRVLQLQEGASTGQTGTPVTGVSTNNDASSDIELQAAVTAVYAIR